MTGNTAPDDCGLHQCPVVGACTQQGYMLLKQHPSSCSCFCFTAHMCACSLVMICRGRGAARPRRASLCAVVHRGTGPLCALWRRMPPLPAAAARAAAIWLCCLAFGPWRRDGLSGPRLDDLLEVLLRMTAYLQAQVHPIGKCKTSVHSSRVQSCLQRPTALQPTDLHNRLGANVRLYLLPITVV